MLCWRAGGSIKSAFEATLWIFSVHPMDVGDVLLIDNERYKARHSPLSLTTGACTFNGRCAHPDAQVAGACRHAPLVSSGQSLAGLSF